MLEQQLCGWKNNQEEKEGESLAHFAINLNTQPSDFFK